MKKLKTYKFRIYPTKEQKILLSKHFGCVRWVYNYALNRKIEYYKKEKKSLSIYEISKELLYLKKQDKTLWLKEVNSQSLQSSLLNLKNSYTKFFKEKTGFPKFKNKKSKQSIQFPQQIKVDFNINKLYIMKFREGIKCKFDRNFEGKIKTTTIYKSSTNKYYTSILVEEDVLDIIKLVPKIEESIGIDLGIKTFATLSDGMEIDNPKYLKNNLDRLKILQRRASKKKLGSCNRKKANLKVSVLHEKIANQRQDFLHKLSTRLIRENQTICLEDLNIKGMMKNHNLAQSISDVSWSEFNRQLEYKAEWHGKNILRIGRFEPSSKVCSECGYKNKELKLSDRTWICTICNKDHDRDINAAKNIKDFSFNKIGQDVPIEPVEMSTLVESVKQEIIYYNMP